ncbi:MAG TPA: sigma-70 family RNA polymerase sigma factor, partial [Verrucomicrobiae bacterium]|nr:sigma-70 family RNA polymerase sigma factor [Verrucomicrobiae bacterium]
MDQTPDTRASLLVRLRDAGDEQAWAEFTAIYGPFVKRLACRRGLQDADADDLSQEVFRTVARAIERQLYDPERGSFRGWLFRIARNLVANFLIHQKRHPLGSRDSDIKSLLEAHPAPRPEDSALFEAEYKRQLLYWAAEQVSVEFSELTWNVFWQAGIEGRSAKEVAEVLGTTVGT